MLAPSAGRGRYLSGMAQYSSTERPGVAPAAAAEAREERRFAELFDRHKQKLGYALLVVILALGGYWLYLRSVAIKTQRAEVAYRSALQSVAAGNIPLAESDLRKAAARYAGTNGGAAAALALARLEYSQGKWREGITAAQGAANREGDLQYDARLLVAAGYEGLHQPAQAARAYEEAAQVARFDGDRDRARAMAARAYGLAGDRQAAIRIWTALAAEAGGGYEAEARLRLGELQARPIGG